MRLESSRLKISRANKHIADLDERVRGLPDSYTATIEINPAGGNKVVKHDLNDRTVTSDVALLVGDAVHNLKCALDYAWLEVITRVAPQAVGDFAKFPVYPSVSDLKGALVGRKLDVTSPELFDLIVSEIQSYQGGNLALWPIHRLDIRDKHRLLIPFVQFVSIEGIEFENETGKSFRSGTWGVIQNPPYYVPVADGWHIKNKGKVAVSIMFDPGIFGQEFRAVDSLKVFSNNILNVVDLMETV